MGGGLMQLVAYGAQDIYLTGNPQITFFKVVYRRYTNFSMEAIEQTFNGQADFGRKVTCTISRNGDLIHRVYLQVTLPGVTCDGSNEGADHGQGASSCSYCFRWTNYVGHILIRSVGVEIGGQLIDRQYGDWLNIWNELTQEPGKQAGYDNMVGNTVSLTGTGHSSTEATTLYVPLQFWFCRNVGLSLPLIALQYHEVKINLEFRQKQDTYVTTSTVLDCSGTGAGCKVCIPSLDYASLFVDYIYLDTDERRRFAQVSHEYLIEQLQFTGDESVTSTNVKVKLNFNHPCKELIWVVQRDDVVAQKTAMGRTVYTNQWTNYTDDYDLDTQWDDQSPNASQLLYTNVESGWSSLSFPSVYTASGPATGYNSYDGVNVASSGDGHNGMFGGDMNTNGGQQNFTTSAVRDLHFPDNWGPGATGDLPPTNFAALTDAAQGSDHAGLGPLQAGRNPTMRAKLQLNGHDRFQERLGSYFNLVQPYQHHTNVPATGINVYSFALRPEEHQPSGTCNMSRIDNCTLQLQLTPKSVGMDVNANTTTGLSGKLRVYATNYNVLRIMSGMGGLAYSN
jgi:hypothetical protein